MKISRTFPPKAVQDPTAIVNAQNNQYSGAEKNLTVGPNLAPMAYSNAGTLVYTTDASTARNIGTGKNFAIYNPGSSGSVTFGAGLTAPLSLSAGATGNDNVGIPCPAGWSYLANYDKSWVISSSNTLLVFIIQDDTTLSTTA